MTEVIHAYDKAHAFKEIRDYYQKGTQPRPRPETETDFELLESLWNDPTHEGMTVLGMVIQSWAAALLPNGWARRLLKLKPETEEERQRAADLQVRMGADALLGKRPFIVPAASRAVYARADGQSVTALEPADRTYYGWAPGIKVCSFPAFPIDAPPTPELLDMACDLVYQETALAEDTLLKALIDALCPDKNRLTASGFSRTCLDHLRSLIEMERLVCGSITINCGHLGDIITQRIEGLEPITDRAALIQGHFADFEGTKLLMSGGFGVEDVIPMNTMYAVAGPEYLGGASREIVGLFAEPFDRADDSGAYQLTDDELQAMVELRNRGRHVPLYLDGEPAMTMLHEGSINKVAKVHSRGWACIELITMALSQSKSVAIGQLI